MCSTAKSHARIQENCDVDASWLLCQRFPGGLHQHPANSEWFIISLPRVGPILFVHLTLFDDDMTGIKTKVSELLKIKSEPLQILLAECPVSKITGDRHLVTMHNLWEVVTPTHFLSMIHQIRVFLSKTVNPPLIEDCICSFDGGSIDHNPHFLPIGHG